MTADTVKHTPGPWSWTRDAQFYHSVYAGEQRVATASDLVADHGKANARLIAAAPDLLKVLKRIDAAMDFDGTCHPLFNGLQKQMQDAIAKAEGRS